MYSTCIFCHTSLGANEAIEHFPVGRRLAFDAAKGRLWVVCKSCERWNLSPLDQRWEAIEECEKLFRDSRLRVSTDNIGLAKLKEGTTLIRIGDPQRPEMAAWRYGDQFQRRRKRHAAIVAGGVVAAGAVLIAGPAIGIAGAGTFNALQFGYHLYANRTIARVPVNGSLILLSPTMLRLVSIHPDSVGGFRVEIPYRRSGSRWLGNWKGFLRSEVRGDAALRVSRQLLPLINRSGAKPAHISDAV